MSKINPLIKIAEVRVEDKQAVKLHEQEPNTRLYFRSLEVNEVTWRPRFPVHLFFCGLISVGLWYLPYFLGKTFFHFLVSCLTG